MLSGTGYVDMNQCYRLQQPSHLHYAVDIYQATSSKAALSLRKIAPEKGHNMYKRILVPIDGSRTSTHGLKEALQLANDSKARMKLLHVVDQSVLALTPEMSAANIVDSLITAGEKTLKGARALAARQGVKVETAMPESLSGRVADVILDEARKWRADLIVMGTHGRRGISHMLLGSDAEAVVRSSPVPVLLVRGKNETRK